MFVPHDFGIALVMMITSAICWGSWANTYKGVTNYRFELFYWDYAVGIFLISLVLAFTMGSTSNDAASFLNNVHSADNSNFFYTLAAAQGERRFAGCRRCVCHHRRDPRWQGLRQLEKSRRRSLTKKHHCLHRLRNLDGSLGALRNSRDDPRTRARSLQHWSLLHAWRLALLSYLERLFHEEAARG